MAYLNWARQRNAWCYTWLAANSGEPGEGNYNRGLWSANTGAACGLKGILWFLGRELAFLANHNAYAEQHVVLKLGKPSKATVFDRKQQAWRPLEVGDGQVRLVLNPACGELLRFEP